MFSSIPNPDAIAKQNDAASLERDAIGVLRSVSVDASEIQKILVARGDAESLDMAETLGAMIARCEDVIGRSIVAGA